MAVYLDALRSTLAELLGQNDGTLTIYMPEALPPALQPMIADAVEQLITYQNRRYAQLYLDRLGRFIKRRDVSDALLGEIALQLARRMMYEDPIRIAQLALQEAAIGADGRATRRVDRKCWLRIDEVISALPIVVADPMRDLIGYLRWLNMPVKMRFNATGWLGIRRLKFEAWLRRWRLLSIRYAKERAWVERWLHMIDRALAKRPDAVGAIVHSATMIDGYGDPYRYGIANWLLIIDGVVKPGLNGTLALTDLTAAIAEARAAALPERKQTTLKRTIAAIQMRAVAEAPAASAAGDDAPHQLGSGLTPDAAN